MGIKIQHTFLQAAYANISVLQCAEWQFKPKRTALAFIAFKSDFTPMLLDKMLGVSSSEVIAAIFELELQGKVRQLPGRSYVKVWYE